jgi:mono/diheme cytochrome c family protein
MNQGPERIDYQETPEVTEVHAVVKREHGEPTAEVTPIPVWLSAICGVAVAWAGVYFGIFHGGFRGDVFNEYASSPAVLFPIPERGGGPAESAGELSLTQQGKAVYANCVPCHMANGMGQPGVFPSLVGTSWVKSEKRLVAILLKGITGPMTVEGKPYNGNMPAWEATLTDKRIAAVASYVRNEWGNSFGEITPEQVAAARKEFAGKTSQWTEAELLQIPEDAPLPGGAEGGAPAAAASAAGDAQKPAEAAPAATAPAAPAPAGGTFDLEASIKRGQPLYMQTCVACHQPTGKGLPGAFPPVAESSYVTENERRLIAILLKGVSGPLLVNGVTYNNVMLPLEVQFPVYKDNSKIADVANYVRNNFGNKAAKPITPEYVAQVRAEFASRATPWTEEDLKKTFPESYPK